MDSLGLITPGVFEIGGRTKREEWMTEEIERRSRRDIEDESYQGKLLADQESIDAATVLSNE